jgi:preprotein translocase subunit YajC
VGYLIVIIALFGLMWLLLVRPQRRRQLEQLRMQDSLHVGDEVVTAGGLRGHVRRLEGEVLRVEIAPGVEVRIDRRAVAGVVPEEVEEGPETPPEGDAAFDEDRREEQGSARSNAGYDG